MTKKSFLVAADELVVHPRQSHIPSDSAGHSGKALSPPSQRKSGLSKLEIPLISSAETIQQTAAAASDLLRESGASPETLVDALQKQTLPFKSLPNISQPTSNFRSA